MSSVSERLRLDKLKVQVFVAILGNIFQQYMLPHIPAFPACSAASEEGNACLNMYMRKKKTTTKEILAGLLFPVVYC